MGLELGLGLELGDGWNTRKMTSIPGEWGTRRDDTKKWLFEGEIENAAILQSYKQSRLRGRRSVDSVQIVSLLYM